MEGDIGRALFILESGMVELTRAGPNGSAYNLIALGPGEFFGEMSLLENLPRSATAVATEESQVHLLYRSRLESLLHYHPNIGVSIMRHLAQLLSARLRHATHSLSGKTPATAPSGTPRA